MRLTLAFSFLLILLEAGVSNINITPSLSDGKFMHIKILDQKQLSFETIQGTKFSELSDLTYDKRTHTLYFVGDEGTLYTFHAKFSKQIDALVPLRATKLKSKKGKRLKKSKRDAEGLTLDGKGKLLISFEGKKPKIASFHKNSDKYGNLIRKYTLAKALKKSKNYRSTNKALEALAWHPQHGILTAAEWALKTEPKKKQTIYALSGKKWSFKAEPESKTAVVAMEVMDDGHVLVMERSYTGIREPLVITVKKVYLSSAKNKLCKTKILAKMSSHEGWDLDNFEGLAKVGKNHYLMVSDNGDNFFQKTLLVYFEVDE